MTSHNDDLFVKSHVARDLLQSAELFRHPDRVIWEYVSNSLQYVDPGVSPKVTVTTENSPKRITIADNGRGMSREDLKRFFTMHGENQDRMSGRPGRGYFGTGKSAAFAVASVLRITTVRDGLRSSVELHKEDLENAKSGDPVPLRAIEMEAPTSEPNGTVVVIERLKPIKLDRNDIMKGLEKHLRHWRGGTVIVNGQLVEPTTIPANSTEEISPDSDDSPLLAGSKLTLSLAKAPLPEDQRGVAVLSNGVLHEITLGSAKGKEMSQYIFGEVDVPALSTPYNGIAAFDMSRSGQLNPENEVVRATYAFLSRHVEAARKRLIDEDKRRRLAAQTARLREEANEIARLINEDYADYSRRFKPVEAANTGGRDLNAALKPAADGDQAFVHGGEQPAIVVGEQSIVRDEGHGGPNSPDASEPKVEPAGDAQPDATGRDEPMSPSRRRPSGGFNVDFRNNGEENSRAFYERESRTIYINLDHPQLVAARGDAEVDDPNFRRLSYEVAFTEYAIGFAQEHATNSYYKDFDEPLFDVRDRIDSVSRKAAHIFRNEH